MIIHLSGYCIELSAVNAQDLYITMCNSSNEYQKWSWKKRERD